MAKISPEWYNKVEKVIDKIKGIASVEFEKMFPEKQPSKVEIELMSGESYSQYLEYPKGDPREPMTQEDLEAKFISLAKGKLSGSRMNDIKDIIFNCESIPTVNEFMNKLII